MRGLLIDAEGSALCTGTDTLECGALSDVALGYIQTSHIHIVVILGIRHGGLQQLQERLASGLGSLLEDRLRELDVLASDEVENDGNLARRDMT